jgi:hypothetical protein
MSPNINIYITVIVTVIHKVLYSQVAKYFGTCLKYQYKLNYQEKSKFDKIILKRRIISLIHIYTLR